MPTPASNFSTDPAPAPAPTPLPAQLGPTDTQFRIGGAIAAPFYALVSLVIVFATDGMSFAAGVVLALAPFMIVYGIAAAIEPKIIRAAGIYGERQQLPKRYFVIACMLGVIAVGMSLPLCYWVYLQATQ